MSEVFLKLLNLSITASWLILAVVIIRPLLKKAPKWINCALWALVALRLVCPFSFESALSLIPSSETIPYDIAIQKAPAIDTGISAVNQVINPIIANSFTPDPLTSANPLQILIPVVSVLWLVGMAALLLYALISYLRLKKSVGVSIAIKDNIMACDDVKSPFILGIMKPIIFVPSSMTGETLDCVINHETAHIKRHDHWWKPLGYLLLTVYWFNPLCWLAYVLLCRDIEMACDEKVIRDMDRNEKAAYSQALLNCNFPRKRIAACPLAFGEVGVKERVKSVLNYKKPAFWIIIVAVIACITVAVCFLTNPSDKSLSGKLGVSMDMAVAEYNHSPYSDGNYIATDYDVLRITKEKGKTTVYAWIYYAEYSFDGTDVKMESASHIPTAVTFDTFDDGSDSSTYDVIEYWIPRDGSDYPKDIRSKFPMVLWSKAFDTSSAAKQKERCLQAAREYYGISNAEFDQEIFRGTLTEISEQTMLVQGEGENDLYSVPIKNMAPSPEPVVGDTVEIVYTGSILETFPASFENVVSVKVIRENSAIRYVDEWPDNEFTSNIPKPSSGTLDYVIDESANGRYAVFFKDITMEQSEAYIEELKNAGYKNVAGTKEDVAIGVMLQKDDVTLSVACSDEGLGIQIIFANPDSFSGSVSVVGGVDGPKAEAIKTNGTYYNLTEQEKLQVTGSIDSNHSFVQSQMLWTNSTKISIKNNSGTDVTAYLFSAENESTPILEMTLSNKEEKAFTNLSSQYVYFMRIEADSSANVSVRISD